MFLNKIRLLSLSLAVAATGLTAACGTDNGDDVTPGCTIDTTYASIHSKILTTPRCNTAFCHDTATAAGGLDYSLDAAAVHAAMVGQPSDNAMATKATRITAGAKADSWFYLKIAEMLPPGGRMPVGGMLAECEIENIGVWIDAGAAQ